MERLVWYQVNGKIVVCAVTRGRSEYDLRRKQESDESLREEHDDG